MIMFHLIKFLLKIITGEILIKKKGSHAKKNNFYQNDF